jgi:nucleoside-diphosphate-sugar epimerase
MPVNFIYVDDLLKAMLMAAEKTAANNKIFFINDGMEYSWGKWNKALTETLKAPAVSIPIAKVVLYAICRVGGVIAKLGGTASFLNPDKWHEIKQDGWLCSSAKIGDELGFRPSWTLDEGIQETALWYRREGWMP